MTKYFLFMKKLSFALSLMLLLMSLPVTVFAATPARAIPSADALRGLGLPTQAKSAQQVRVPGRNVLLGGVMVWNDDWYDSEATINAGPVKFGMNADTDLIPLTGSDRTWMDVYAATPVGDVYYVISGTKYGTENENAYFGSFSLNNWSGSLRKQGLSWSSVASDLAYDPISDKIYGFFVDNVGQEADNDFHYLGTIDINGTSSDIGRSDRAIYAISFDDNGNLYGVNTYGGFVLIDKSNATNKVLIWPSDFGIDAPAEGECNSMTYDSASGKFYWAATVEQYEGVYPNRKKVNKGMLIEIDPVAKTMTKVMDMPGNASIAGLYVISSEAAADAPGVATDLAVSFDEQFGLTGTLFFTAPSVTASGATLEGALTATIALNGQTIERDGFNAGETVNVTGLTFVQGDQTATVTISQGDVTGDAASFSFYAGQDEPGSPLNVILTEGEAEGEIKLSWQPAPAGKNGGPYDIDGATYTVVRYPDATTVAEGLTTTSFTEVVDIDAVQTVYYTVTAVTSRGSSEPAESNKLSMGAGYTVPFLETFDTVDRFNLWTIVNSNGGATWQYDDSKDYLHAYYKYDENKLPADDWFISPKIHLTAGTKYKVLYSARVFSKSYPENFKVCLGTAPTPEGMTIEIADHPNFNSGQLMNFEQYVTIEADGDYYLGFYCYSAVDMYRLCIDNVGMEVVDNNVPGAVTDLTVTAGGQGAMEATIAFTAPSTNSDGGQLATLTDIKVYRNTDTTPIHTFDNPAIGAKLSWVDNTMTEAGTYVYRIVPSNELGAGVDARESAFVGVDVPGAVQNLRLEETAGGIVLTWEPPLTGRNGGYYDPTNLNYHVWNYLTLELLGTVTETSFTDNKVDLSKQDLGDYLVYTYDDTKPGYYAEVMALIGKPYDAPFVEKFQINAQDGLPDMDNYPWLSEANHSMNVGINLQAAGQYPVAEDQTGDGGMAVLHSRGEADGGVFTFSSPMINIEPLATPTLSFYMYHSHDEAVTTGETLTVKVSVDGFNGWQDLDDATFARDNGNTGWEQHSIDLSAFAGENRLRVAFIGTTAGGLDEGLDIYIDSITIDNAPALIGDVNADGVVNANDISIIVNIIAGLADAEDTDGRADVNGDGVINANDIAMVVNIIAGLNTAE